MKKETLDIIERVAENLNIHVTYANTTGIYSETSHVEFQVDTRTWMDYDFYFIVWYHPTSEDELSEIFDEVNKYYENFDPDQEAKDYIRYSPNSPYRARQIVEEFEKIDCMLANFADALCGKIESLS